MQPLFFGSECFANIPNHDVPISSAFNQAMFSSAAYCKLRQPQFTFQVGIRARCAIKLLAEYQCEHTIFFFQLIAYEFAFGSGARVYQLKIEIRVLKLGRSPREHTFSVSSEVFHCFSFSESKLLKFQNANRQGEVAQICTLLNIGWLIKL